MAVVRKRKLTLATIVYWVLLFYIIAALMWWALSLFKQNHEIYDLKKLHLTSIRYADPASYTTQLHQIEDEWSRNKAKYYGEGATFLLLILVGAVFIYRSVRRQFKLQQQQQNFVMAITHELKTPISVSRLNLETLQKYSLDESQKNKLLQMTLQETFRLDTLINNILISSQLDGRSYTVAKEEINFSLLTADVVQQFRNRYPERNVTAELDEEVAVDGDPLLLKLLVSNLLENANKYSPKGAKIEVSVRQKQSKIRFEVTDEGPGIPDKEKKNIFKKFYRIGSESTRRTQGTGLGLYLCKKIAEDHHAGIYLKNNQPQGSKFIVEFQH